MNSSHNNFYPRHTAAYGGLVGEKCCKGRGGYNGRILCAVTGDYDKKKETKIREYKINVTSRKERGSSGIMELVHS